MKKHLLPFLLIVLMSTVGTKTFAHDIEVPNADGKTIYYNWINNKTELAVSCRDDECWRYSDRYSGNVVIPSTVVYQGSTYNVTSIERNAFYRCGLTSVTIPNSIKSIGYEAFSDCKSLISITISIPNSLTEIGLDAFDGSRNIRVLNLLIKDINAIYNNIFHMGTQQKLIDNDGNEIKEIIIPNNVTTISDQTFSGCSGLTSITIPNSVTSIGSCAFYGCTGLTSLTIPNSVTSIGYRAFSGCINLTSLNISNKLISIGDEAFIGCSGLTSITFPKSLKTIGNDAFYGCSGLTSITIPNSVSSIGYRTFSYCGGLSSIQVESGNNNYDSRNNCNAIIDNNNQLVVGCKNTIIPNSVTSIGVGAFKGCKELTSMNIPQNVTSIGSDAFMGCTGLVYVTLPSNLTSIGDYCFRGCMNLSFIYCSAKSVPSAGHDAFGDNKNITMYVHSESINEYTKTSPWSNYTVYMFYYNNSQGLEKCSKPTISFSDGKFIFNSETPDVIYNWAFSSASGIKGSSYPVSPVSLSVFASKSGYQNSDVATYLFTGLVGDVNADGKVDVADHVELTNIIMNQK